VHWFERFIPRSIIVTPPLKGRATGLGSVKKVALFTEIALSARACCCSVMSAMPSLLHRHDEAGHIHFWTISTYRRLQFFHDDGIKLVLLDGLRLLQNRHAICLIGYVIMPEHIHVLLLPHARGSDVPIPIGELLHDFKQYTALYAKQRLREVWSRRGRLWSGPLNDWATGRFEKQSIWFTRGYDRNITREETLHEKLNYCHKNPVTRGLVATAGEWRWSSYRYYETPDAGLLRMDWDGRWPIEW